MQRALAFVVLFGFPAAYGNECAAAYKHKANLATLTCSTNVEDAASCNSACCELNKNTCGGFAESGKLTCAWDKYAAGTDAWKNLGATDANKNTVCCEPKVTCSNSAIAGIMPAGKKLKANVASVRCASDAASCVQGDICVELDSGKCGGGAKVIEKASGAQAACKKDTANNKGVKGSDDAWKNLALTLETDGKVTQANYDAKCCGPILKCDDTAAGVTCPSGKKAKAATKCTNTGGADSTDPKDCQRKTGNPAAMVCCELNTDTCGGYTAAEICDNTRTGETGLSPSGSSATWKGTKATTQAERKANCCIKTPTCSAVSCTYVGGKSAKNKANSATVKCPAGKTVTECGTATECCEVDAQKCGAFTRADVVCPFGTIDERTTWGAKVSQSIQDAWNNKPGNTTNKNTNCCTPVAKCALPVGTTTPAATATPAAPALKFSKHEVSVEQSHGGANMVWLGVGALAGMSVLMVVQRLRSSQADEATAREVEVLLEESLE